MDDVPTESRPDIAAFMGESDAMRNNLYVACSLARELVAISDTDAGRDGAIRAVVGRIPSLVGRIPSLADRYRRSVDRVIAAMTEGLRT